jgi:hypothetical protein
LTDAGPPELAVSLEQLELGARSAIYSAGVAARIHGAGVTIRLATEDEVAALARARLGGDLDFEPSRSFRSVERDYPTVEDGVYVVSQAFVEFSDDEGAQRWDSAEFHGLAVSPARDATLELLRLSEETADNGLIELLSDMRIAGLKVSRWALMSAPRRIELDAELEASIAPLRRG